MNKINKRPGSQVRSAHRGALMMVLVVAMSTLLSGCFFWAKANRDIAEDGAQPWWCLGAPALSDEQCLAFSLRIDSAIAMAHQYPTVADFTDTGATEFTDRPAGIGVPFGFPSATFDPATPNILLYAGDSPDSRLVGIAWAVASGATPPEGFEGGRDVWTTFGGNEWLALWVIRGYENHPDVFAASHPCLASGVTLTSTTDACFIASHTQDLEIIVTNDDGVLAEGIDALVEGLMTVSGISIEIVAPATNQSGSSDTTTPGPETASPATTLSGRAATAVDGTPADSVLYALRVMKKRPDLILSGINKGQNFGPISAISGTVGAARTARRNGIDAIATSQGYGGIVVTPDFPAGVIGTLALLERWRLGLAGVPFMEVPSINIPSCELGYSVRGTIDTLAAPDMLGRSTVLQDCSSTELTINDDVDAFNHGFISVTDVGKYTPPNWPD